MHILVTDRLACPRCGPPFGLVLLAEELRDRRVSEGTLGCSNCRERYPVEAGFGDFRPSPRVPITAPPVTFADDPEPAMKVAALLGVREGPGLLLVSGDAARHAPRVAAMIEGIEVVAVHPGLREVAGSEGVTRLATGDVLPFLTGSLRGVWIEGEVTETGFREAVRVLGPGARLVAVDPAPGTKERMEDEGLDLLLEAEGTLVGARK